MIRDNFPQTPNSGVKISSLPTNQTVLAIVKFLEKYLPIFRDEYVVTMPSHLEDDISQELVSVLQEKAKSNNFIFNFNARKGVDFRIKVSPLEISAKPIFEIEAKRLPPTNNKDYVQGDTGGIERFKREKAGFAESLNECAMIAYVQQHAFNHWFRQVNKWISDLVQNNHEITEIDWAESDRLVELPSNSEVMAIYSSRHSRKTREQLTIRHYWLNMQG